MKFNEEENMPWQKQVQNQRVNRKINRNLGKIESWENVWYLQRDLNSYSDLERVMS